MQAFVALVFALFPLLEVRATEEPGAWEETLLETTVKSLAICKAYVSGLCKGISQQNMAKNMVQYLHFRILEFPFFIGIYENLIFRMLEIENMGNTLW